MENVKHIRLGARALVLGDIHGNIAEFEKAAAFALMWNLPIVSLGDLVDYGDQNLDCIELMHTLMFDGVASMIIGNHDYKFNKWIDQSREGDVRVQVKGGLVNSVDEVNANDGAADVLDKFQEIYENSSFVLRAENTIFVHAAVHPKFWGDEFNSKLRARALFGQVNGYVDNYPNRIYDWVDDMPDENTAYFGHDIISREKMTTIKYKAFGIDTGSSKEGKLTGVVVELQNGRYVPVQELDFDK